MIKKSVNGAEIANILQEKINKEFKAIKFLPGIDSFYFFAKIDVELYRKVYENNIKMNDLPVDYAEFLGTSGIKSGFCGKWFILYYEKDKFKMPVCRIGFKDPDKQEQIENIYIQLDAMAIYTFDLPMALEIVRFFLADIFRAIVTNEDLICSRVDVNCFVNGFDFSKVTADCFGGSFRHRDIHSNGIGKANRTETLYLGSRSSKCHFVIYDKKIEMNENKNLDSVSIKKAYFKINGFDLKNEIWNLEFRIKREYLQECFINTADDLLKGYKRLFYYVFSTLHFYGFDTALIKRHRDNNNLHRLKIHDVWTMVRNCVAVKDEQGNFDFKYIERDFRHVKPKSKELSQEFIKQQLTKYLKLSREAGVNPNDLKNLLSFFDVA